MMEDCKNHGGKECPEKNQNQNNHKNKNTNPAFVFNRSITISSAAEVNNKPLYNLYNSSAFQRKGSLKNAHSPSFVSMVSAGNALKGKVKKLCSILESSPKRPSNPVNSQSSSLPPKPLKLLSNLDSNTISSHIPLQVLDSPFKLPGTEDRVVIFFTSLRGIRKTFQDCHSIRMIFRGFRVNIDERDISMDVLYKRELQKVFGENNVSLPQVFIKGKYIGGADMIKQLLEAGELIKLIKGLPLRAPKPCDACDDVRFVPCANCHGSRKVFDEDEEQSSRCTDCNENGLVRCPLCCL